MSSQTNLGILLSKLGWGSGFRIPVANAENQELEKNLEQVQQRNLELRIHISEEVKVLDNLKQHLGRVTTEIGISKKLLQSKQSSAETEENIVALDERQVQNITREINESCKAVAELEDRNQAMHRELQSRRKKMERDQDLLRKADLIEAFKKALEAKEHDISYVLNLANIDQKLVDEFEAKFQKYGEILQNAKNDLNSTVQFTHTLDSQFERVCSQYRRAHLERIQAIDLWKKSLDALTRRDLEIRAMGHEYAKTLSLIQRSENTIKRKQELLTFQEYSSKSLDRQVLKLDKELSMVRSQITRAIEVRHNLTDEIVGHRISVAGFTNQIKQCQKEIIQLDEEAGNMENKTRLADAELHVIQEKYKEELTNVTSVENRMEQLEFMIIDEENKEDELMKEMERMRKFLFQKSNEHNSLKTKSSDIDFEIRSLNIMFRNLRERAKNDFLEVQKKKHLSYELELRVLEVETKYHQLSTLQIVEPGPTAMYYNSETLARCREELDEAQKEKLLVSNQKSHLEGLVRRFNKEIDADINARTQLEKELMDIRFNITLVERQLSKKVDDMRHFEVEQVLINLEHRKFIITEREQKEKLVTMEQQRLYLQMAATERRTEIEEHKSMLKLRLNMIRDEKSRRIFQRNEVLMELERRKKKYEIAMASLASKEDREKEDFSEAVFILKNAQEREAIKREGDMWDCRVKEAEKEMAALQNTLQLVTGSNKAFKESLAPIKSSTEEAGKIRELEHAQREAIVRKRKAEKLQRELAKHCSAKESEIFNLTQTIEMLASVAEDKKYELNAVMVEIASQKAKIERANKVAARLIRDLGNQSDADKKLIEAELQLKCAREKFSFALKTLDRAVSAQPNMIESVSEYLTQNPLLTDVAKRLSIHGRCTDSQPVSGSTTPKPSTRGSTCRKSRNIDKYVGTLFERRSKYTIGSSKVDSIGSLSSGSSRSSSSKSSKINVQHLRNQFQHMKRGEEILYPGPD